MTTGPNDIQEECLLLFQHPYSLEYLLEKSIELKNTLWLTDIWNIRDVIDNKEQDPEILQGIVQQETMRMYLGGNIIFPRDVFQFQFYDQGFKFMSKVISVSTPTLINYLQDDQENCGLSLTQRNAHKLMNHP